MLKVFGPKALLVNAGVLKPLVNGYGTWFTNGIEVLNGVEYGVLGVQLLVNGLLVNGLLVNGVLLKEFVHGELNGVE